MSSYSSKLQKRLELNALARKDPIARIDIIQRCAEDTLYWFDNFAWTFDPRKTPSEIPFIPYEGQQTEYIKFLDYTLKNPQDIFIDKPRDVGATALTSNFLLKHWLFASYFNALIGSRKEDYVDRKGDPNTIFHKLDYTLDRLPSWMIPRGFEVGKHRSHLKLVRPDSDNTITGESANPNFGRGGRQTMVLFDELGFWPWAKAVWESAGDVTSIRVAMTTPPDTGKASYAYKLLSGQAGKINIFDFDYKAVPSKDSDWLKEQKERRSEEEFEREINKSYSGTTEGRVYATEWNLHVSEDTELKYDPSLPLFVSWDFGLDAVAMIWWQKDYKYNHINMIDCYQNSNKSIDFYIPFITGTVISGVHQYTPGEILKIVEHKKWRKDVAHFGDPDVHKRNLVNKQSAYSVLAENGIIIQSKPWANNSHKQLREKAKLMFRRLTVNPNTCSDAIEAIKSSRYPKRTETSQNTNPISKPIHDDSSHFRTSMEYFADNEPTREDIRDRKKGTFKVKYKYRPI